MSHNMEIVSRPYIMWRPFTLCRKPPKMNSRRHNWQPQGYSLYGWAVYRYHKTTAILKVTVLYIVGFLNTVRRILRKSLHVDEISSRWHTLKLQRKWQQHDNHIQRPKVYTYYYYYYYLFITPEGISLTHSYGKENRREHCRRFARLNFCRSCLQLMTSRNTTVYRYHGIFETAYYRRAFPNTAHP